jgi:L-aspartate oxidase
MARKHRLADLAPRDVVAREIYREQRRSGAVVLDAKSLGRTFATRFPGIFALCQARGIDPRTDPIPVTPAAHYMMGGIVTDLAGRSSLPGLFACGELARTGVHGANRLASNSLLEGLVFAERIARELASEGRYEAPRRPAAFSVPPLADRGAAQVAADTIRRVMWDNAGIDRDAKGLRSCLKQLALVRERLSAGMTEEANMCDTARMIAAGALARRESRGGHFRSDYPRPRADWRGRHVEF